MYNLYKNWTNLCRYRTKALRIHRLIRGTHRLFYRNSPGRAIQG